MQNLHYNSTQGGFIVSDNVVIVKAIYSGLSQRQVAVIHMLSRNTIVLLLHHVNQQGCMKFEDLNKIDEAIFINSLSVSQAPKAGKIYKMPDYDFVHSEQAKPQVTLKLLWEVSFVDLQQQEVVVTLEKINEAPLTGKTESRWTNYLSEEKEYMLPLPLDRFEFVWMD